jgi:hypothetical protein
LKLDDVQYDFGRHVKGHSNWHVEGFVPEIALVHGYYPMNSAAYFKNASYSQALSGKFFEI